MTRRVTATQEARWKQQGGDPMYIGECEDGARNTVLGWATLDGSYGFLHMELREAVTGRLMDDIDVVPADNMKLNRCSMWIRDDKVWARFFNHLGGEGQPEDLSRDAYPWAAQGLVPIPFGEPHMGRDGAIPLAGGGGGTVDPAAIQEALRVVLGLAPGTNMNITSALANVVGNIKPKAAAALTDAQVMTVLQFIAGGDARVWQQLINTSYAADLSALRDWNGGNPNATARETLQQLDELMARVAADLPDTQP